MQLTFFDKYALVTQLFHESSSIHYFCNIYESDELKESKNHKHFTPTMIITTKYVHIANLTLYTWMTINTNG